jgi:hypothetical protein
MSRQGTLHISKPRIYTLARLHDFRSKVSIEMIERSIVNHAAPMRKVKPGTSLEYFHSHFRRVIT